MGKTRLARGLLASQVPVGFKRKRCVAKFSLSLVLFGLTACTSGIPTPSNSPLPPSTDVGFISAAQADRGKGEFDARCLECHVIGDFVGEDFEWSWRRQNVWNLYAEMSVTMPEDFPGDLDDQTYVDIIAYILRVNGYQIGGPELVPTRESLSVIELGANATKTKKGRNDDGR